MHRTDLGSARVVSGDIQEWQMSDKYIKGHLRQG